MNEAHSILLNENALKKCNELQKPTFIYEWMRHLDMVLSASQANDLLEIRERLIQQLQSYLSVEVGPPTRHLLARCLSRIHSREGNTSKGREALNETIRICNDTLKLKEEPTNLPLKLASLVCLAHLYDSIGGNGTFEETFALISKGFYSAESQQRTEILNTLSKMIERLGTSGSTVQKDLLKLINKTKTMQDRVPSVRTAAVKCLSSLVPVYPLMYATDLEATCTLAVKALDGSTYETRLAVSQLFSILFSLALQPPLGATLVHKNHLVPVTPVSLDDALHMLANGFLKGGISGSFLKTSSGNSASANGSRETRVGVAMGYVSLLRELGSNYLEKNLTTVCKHLLNLAAKTGTLSSPGNPGATEAVALRRCISFILRSTIGDMLSEHSQVTACKVLGALLSEFINSFDYSVDPGIEPILTNDAYSSANAATVALLEISCLVRQIGTAVTPLFVEASGIMEPVFACLLHPVQSTRVAAAWCLRCVTVAVPSQLTPLIDRCLSRLDHMKSSNEAISGYSLALSGLISASADCKLGIPNGKPTQVFNCAKDMLRTATQPSRLALPMIKAGWLLIHSLCILGAPVIKEHMRQIVKLWTSVFPRSLEECKKEMARGDLFTWHCTLESQAGALAVMCAIASHKDMLTDDVNKSMMIPIQCSLGIISEVGVLTQLCGLQIRPIICAVRIRLYELLLANPLKSYDSAFFALLVRELVADITLSDNSGSTQLSSFCHQLCSGAEVALLTPWLGTTDESLAEDMLQSPNYSIANLDVDPYSVSRKSFKDVNDLWPEPESSLTLCLNLAIQVYAKIYHLIAARHKLQITEHFLDKIKNSKNNKPRQQAIQQNILTALALSLRCFSEQRLRMNNEPLQKAVLSLIVEGITSPLTLTRCISAEAIGRLAQVVGEPPYVASLAQFCFDKVRTEWDGCSRAGYALSLGAIHRHVGSLGSPQHLNTVIGIVLALAQDGKNGSPSTQACSLISLALIAETGGGMIGTYVEFILDACLKLLLGAQSFNVEVALGAGKLLSALMTCVGPELSCPGPIEKVRSSMIAACAIQLSHPSPLVQAEAFAGLQQMHMYAPRHINLSHLVVDIVKSLNSNHLCVRKAAVCCLRQLVQREAREVREHSQCLVPQCVADEAKKLPLPDTGLEGRLFSMLDLESHPTLRSHLKETLISLVQASSSELLGHWLSLCKDILASTGDTAKSTIVVEDKSDRDLEDEEEGDDDATLQGIKSTVVDKGKVLPRWPTRVFASEIVQKLMSVCDTERAHLDLVLANELQMASDGRSDYLVLHLSDLVRMSFMGATSDNTQLRLAGLMSLQGIINRFSAVPEPEFPGHVILEQFQAQVGAALRPAFSEDTPSHVTAAACQVCSTWIGSGVARDLNDLRRVHQLLVSSLVKLKHGSINTQLYSEAAATLEKLSILKAWAEIYITAVKQENNNMPSQDEEEIRPSESLLSLVSPELSSLIDYWLAVLYDSAILSLPLSFSDQLPQDGGAFYKSESAEVSREYYRTSWPPILLASSVYLEKRNFKHTANSDLIVKCTNTDDDSRFFVMLGLAVETMCSKTSYIDDDVIQICTLSIKTLLSCEWCQLQLMSNAKLAIELCNVLHRIILTRDNMVTQKLCAECALSVVNAAVFSMKHASSLSDVENGNIASNESQPMSCFIGDEGTDGVIAGSLTFSLLELCLCLFVRQMPQINSAHMKSRSTAPLHVRRFCRLSVESTSLLKLGIDLILMVPSLCCGDAKPSVLTVILYLLIGFIRESAKMDENSVVPEVPPGHLTAVATYALQALRSIASTPPTDATLTGWTTIMQSTLYSLLVLCEGDNHIDDCMIMLSCVVLASASPSTVVTGHHDNLRRLVGLIKKHLKSDNPQVVCKALQSACSLFSRKEIRSPFIHYLGKDVVQTLKPVICQNDTPAKIRNVNEEQLSLIQESIRTIEVLAAAAEGEKKMSVISLLSQSLGRLLCASNTEEWRQLSPIAKRLHEWVIQRLNTVAVDFPNEFRMIIARHSELNQRLQAALVLQANRQSLAKQAMRNKLTDNKATTQQPTIKLKMDFNAFGKT